MKIKMKNEINKSYLTEFLSIVLVSFHILYLV